MPHSNTVSCRVHARFGQLFDFKSAKEDCCGMTGILRKHLNAQDCEECEDGTPFWRAPSAPAPHNKWQPPKEITCDFLVQSLLEARERLRSKDWSHKMALSFLKSRGIQDTAISPFLEGNTVPSTWQQCIEPSAHVDAPMHLLFLGVQKSLIRQLQRWLRTKKKESAFNRSVGGLLDHVQQLGLVRWLNVAPFREGSLGGWVGESYVGFARCAIWFLSRLSFLMPDEDLECRPEDASRAQLKNWLQCRAITPQIGASPDVVGVLVDQVKSAMAAALPITGGGCALVQDVFSKWWRVLRHVMARTADRDHIRLAEEAIQAFILVFDAWDREIYEAEHEDADDSKRDPKWLSSYNFLSLLNLTATMRTFGPLRGLWEGGKIGEGILRDVKPDIVSGLKWNWAINLHKKLVAKKAANALAVDIDENKRQRSRSEGWVKRYASIVSVQEAIMACMPVSAVVLNNVDEKKTIGCLTTTNHIVGLSSFRDEGSIDVFGWTYLVFRTVHPDDELPLLTKDNEIEEFVVLLPLMTDGGFIRNMYTVVSSEWRNVFSNEQD